MGVPHDGVHLDPEAAFAGGSLIGMVAVLRGLVPRSALLVLSVGCGACLFPEYTFTESTGGSGGKGSSSSASVTSSSTSATSTSVSSSSGGPPMENCFNGTDDDDDELADCEDPDCAPDTECVDPIPVGWGTFGYVVLGEAATAPACPSYAASVKYSGNKDLANTGFSCSNCSCGTPMNRDCDLETDLDPGTGGLQLFQVRNVACSNMNATNIRTLTAPDPWSLACDATNTSTGGQSCVGQPCNTSVFTQTPTVSGGSCTPAGGVINKTSPTWQTASNACGGIPALAGCEGGKKCMPRSDSPYFAGVCIGKAGDQICPAPFNTKHVYYKNFVDDRACTACTCQSPSGGTCGISLTLYSDAACGGAAITTFNAGTCQDLTGNPTIAGRSGVVSTPPTGGSCPPTSLTSAKLGDVIPTSASATTFCCL